MKEQSGSQFKILRIHRMVKFFVPGRARPKGSPRVITRSKNGKTLSRPMVITDTPKSSRWQKAVMAMANRAMSPDHDDDNQPWCPSGFFEVSLAFVFDRPMSHWFSSDGVSRGCLTDSGKKFPYPGLSFGDVDKLARTTLDGIEASGMIENDTRVVWMMASKEWVVGENTEGCHVTVTRIA